MENEKEAGDGMSPMQADRVRFNELINNIELSTNTKSCFNISLDIFIWKSCKIFFALFFNSFILLPIVTRVQ